MNPKMEGYAMSEVGGLFPNPFTLTNVLLVIIILLLLMIIAILLCN